VARRFHLTVSLLRRPHRTSLNSHSGCQWHPEPPGQAQAGTRAEPGPQPEAPAETPSESPATQAASG